MLESLLGPTADPWTAALVFVSAVVLAPVAEEVLFRGLLLPHLGRSLPSFTAIYVGALLFGMLHVSHGVMLIGPLVLGALLGWARLRSRGLLAPILLHVSFNGFATISSWAS
jgi:membrane protease YdiL (CAAX protease family)